MSDAITIGCGEIGAIATLEDGVGPGAPLSVLETLGIKVAAVSVPKPDQLKRSADYYLQCVRAGVIPYYTIGHFEDGDDEDAEDYSGPEAAINSCGLVPEKTRAKRANLLLDQCRFAIEMKSFALTAHIGAVSRLDAKNYDIVVGHTRDACDLLLEGGASFGEEFGQETVDDTLRFLDDVDRPNIFANMDGGNGDAYNTVSGDGGTIGATKKFGPRIGACHFKRYGLSESPGKKFGPLLPLNGENDGGVDLYEYAAALVYNCGFRGPWIMEVDGPVGNAYELGLARLRQIHKRIFPSKK